MASRRQTSAVTRGQAARRAAAAAMQASAAQPAGGMAVNFLVYGLALSALRQAWWTPGAAVACGSAAGLVVNFVSAKFLVFKS